MKVEFSTLADRIHVLTFWLEAGALLGNVGGWMVGKLVGDYVDGSSLWGGITNHSARTRGWSLEDLAWGAGNPSPLHNGLEAADVCCNSICKKFCRKVLCLPIKNIRL